LKTYSAKKNEIQQSWYVIDAQGKTLGRFASQVARILRGKHKPIFTPNVDTGDFVIVINADKVRITGKKAKIKLYRHYTGYPGGFREESFEKRISRKPESVVYEAVWGMLPHNRLGKRIIKKLKVYTGSEHPHSAQRPAKMEIKY
jgi:large subunit ribosomal protein L13